MDRETWVLAGVMGSVHFAFHVFMRLVPPLIPILAVDLGFPLWKLGLLVSVYLAASSVGLLPAGVLSDAYDRRAVLTLGLSFVSGGYLLFAFSPVIGTWIPTVSIASYTIDGPVVAMNAAMFVAGLGSSVHVPVGVPIVTANAGEDTGKVLGIWSGASKVGDATTPALVGVLILGFAWNHIVLAFGLFGLAYTAGLFAVLGLGYFETVPVAQANDDANGEESTVSSGTDPRVYVYPMIALMLYFAGYQIASQGVVTFTPTFVTDVYSYHFTSFGVTFGPESFADFALSILLVAGALSRFGAGFLVDRYDHRSVLLGALAIAAVALLVFTFVPLGPIALLAVLAVFGGALYGNAPARDTLISDLSPAGREGRTFSYLWTASRIFGALSPVAIGYAADTVGIQSGFGYLAGAVVVAAVAVSLLFSRRVYVDAGEVEGAIRDRGSTDGG